MRRSFFIKVSYEPVASWLLFTRDNFHEFFLRQQAAFVGEQYPLLVLIPEDWSDFLSHLCCEVQVVQKLVNFWGRNLENVYEVLNIPYNAAQLGLIGEHGKV